MPLKCGKIGEGVPVILVPSAFSTLITIYNVKEFLEDGVFIPTDVKLKQTKGAKPDCVTVQKKFSRDRVVTAHEVRDKPSALKNDDWERVVAVFVLGKDWQFKEWPFKNHVEIFNKILGFFMRFEDDNVESAKTVKQWNVKIISVISAKIRDIRTELRLLRCGIDSKNSCALDLVRVTKNFPLYRISPSASKQIYEKLRILYFFAIISARIQSFYHYPLIGFLMPNKLQKSKLEVS
ncbi:accessory factor associated with RNA polymerase II [Orobanche gracilis]